MRNHKKLKTLARKMRTKKEIKERTPIFQTKYWDNRVEMIRKKISNKISKIYAKRNL